MNTTDINELLRRDEWTASVFKGCVARDEFISRVRRVTLPALFVFNTQDADRTGEHWMAVSLTENGCYYFDSYGRPPTVYPDILTSLRQRFSTIESNSVQPQGLTTTACGDYCVLFCLLVTRGWSGERVVARLSRIPGNENRDHAVRETLVLVYGAEAYHTLRRVYPDLVGRHKLHIRPAIRLLSRYRNFVY